MRKVLKAMAIVLTGAVLLVVGALASPVRADGGQSGGVPIVHMDEETSRQVVANLNSILSRAKDSPVSSITSINGIGYYVSREAVTTGDPGVVWLSVTGDDGNHYSIAFGNKNVLVPNGDITPLDSVDNTTGSIFGDQFSDAWQQLADEGKLDTSNPWINPILSSAANGLTYVPYIVKGNMPVIPPTNPTPNLGYVAFNKQGTVDIPVAIIQPPGEDDDGEDNGNNDGNSTPLPPSGGGSTAVEFGAAEAVIDFGTDIKNAVVIRQDPDRRGADVYVTLRSCPVVYHYVEKRTYTTERCIYSATPPKDWNGCEPGHKGDKHWHKIVETHVKYIPRTETVKDPVNLRDFWDLSAHLTRPSQQWISGELEARYYNAYIEKPDWDLSRIPTIRVIYNYYDAQGCNVVRIGVTRIPFVDPGWYDTVAEFYSTGTKFTPPPGVDIARWPVFTATYPKVMRDKKPLHIWMWDETLVR